MDEDGTKERRFGSKIGEITDNLETIVCSALGWGGRRRRVRGGLGGAGLDRGSGGRAGGAAALRLDFALGSRSLGCSGKLSVCDVQRCSDDESPEFHDERWFDLSSLLEGGTREGEDGDGRKPRCKSQASTGVLAISTHHASQGEVKVPEGDSWSVRHGRQRHASWYVHIDSLDSRVGCQSQEGRQEASYCFAGGRRS